MTFEQFQSTRKWADRLATVLSPDGYFGDLSGFVYAGDLYIESALDIDGATGEFLLTTGNEQTFGDLETLERQLFDFATSEELT